MLAIKNPVTYYRIETLRSDPDTNEPKWEIELDNVPKRQAVGLFDELRQTRTVRLVPVILEVERQGDASGVKFGWNTPDTYEARITINGTPYTLNVETLTYDDLVALIDGDPDVCYAITYHLRGNFSGTVKRGAPVRAQHGLDITMTSHAFR